MPVFCKNIAKYPINIQRLILVTLTHLTYDIFAYLAHKDALVPTEKIVVKEQFPVFQPERADDILVRYVRDKELRQSFGIDYFFARFLYIFQDIRHGAA